MKCPGKLVLDLHSENIHAATTAKNGLINSDAWIEKPPADSHRRAPFISLPKIKKNSQMDFFNWSPNDPLVINKYGIPEPVSKKIRYPDILLVPLVAFDKNFNIIGYGGGYYDRYLAKVQKKKKILTIGFAFSFQQIRKVHRNKFDRKLDFIITENSFI